MKMEESKLLHLTMGLAKQLNSVIIRWDQNSKQMNVSSSSNEYKSLRYKRWLHYSLSFIYITAGLVSLSFTNEKIKSSEVLQTTLLFCMGGIGCIGGCLHQTVLWKNAYDVCVFVNGIMTLPQTTLAKGSKHNVFLALNQAVSYGLIISVVIFLPTFVFGFHLITPCKPSLMGYWLLPECWSTKIPTVNNNPIYFLPKLFIMLVNYWIIAFGLNAGCFAASFLMILCTIKLQENLRR